MTVAQQSTLSEKASLRGRAQTSALHSSRLIAVHYPVSTAHMPCCSKLVAVGHGVLLAACTWRLLAAILLGQHELQLQAQVAVLSKQPPHASQQAT